ncbi:hypothetical protein BH10ACT7_BH10ACT7_19830 [soil metagenome]
MNSRWARVARGWAAAAFATFAAALSHALAGGSVPTPFAMLVALVISGAICTLLTGRGLSLWRLALSVAASQALFHGLFVSLGSPVPVGHEHAFAVAGVDEHATMWAAHAVAAVITIAAFRYAEVAFWGVAETARLLFARLVGRIIPLALPPRMPAPRRPHIPTITALVLASTLHRGPPEVLGA